MIFLANLLRPRLIRRMTVLLGGWQKWWEVSLVSSPPTKFMCKRGIKYKQPGQGRQPFKSKRSCELPLGNCEIDTLLFGRCHLCGWTDFWNQHQHNAHCKWRSEIPKLLLVFLASQSVSANVNDGSVAERVDPMWSFPSWCESMQQKDPWYIRSRASHLLFKEQRLSGGTEINNGSTNRSHLINYFRHISLRFFSWL